MEAAASQQVEAQIDSRSIFHKVWKTVQNNMDEKRIAGEFYIHQAIPEKLCINSDAFESILLNLILNAIESTPLNGTVIVMISWFSRDWIFNDLLKPTDEFHSRFQSFVIKSQALCPYIESQSASLPEADAMEEDDIPQERPDNLDETLIPRGMSPFPKKQIEAFQRRVKEYEMLSSKYNVNDTNTYYEGKREKRQKSSRGFIKIEVYHSGYIPLPGNDMYQSMMTQNTDNLEVSNRLQIVEQLCQSLKGEVKWLSRKHEGTQSVAVIPASYGPLNSLDSTTKLNALLVDHDIFSTTSWEHRLKDLGDFTIESAHNGKQAVDIFMSKPEGYFDFILMNLELHVFSAQDLSAQETMKQIRQYEKNRGSQVRLIVVSKWHEQIYEYRVVEDKEIKAYHIQELPIFSNQWEEILEKIVKEKWAPSN